MLVGLSGLSITGLAGCLGDDGQEDDMAVQMGSAGGGTWDSALAFERAVSQESDALQYSTIETEGNIASTYGIAEGNFDGAFMDRNSMAMAQAQEGPFEDNPVEILPWMGFRAFPYNIFILARSDTDIETFDDLAGANFYPAQPGYSTRAMTLAILEHPETRPVYDEMNIVDMDVSDAPGAMEEGSIDAAIAYGTPGIGMTGWVTEYDARVDVHYVEATDELIQAAEDYPGAGTARHDPDVFQMENDLGTDETFGWNFEVGTGIHPETSADAVYEMARIAHENTDTIQEAEPRFNDIDEAAELTRMGMEDYPWHPGIAQYLQDHDAWNDDWIVGEEPGSYFL